jgi:hypothetical protein
MCLQQGLLLIPDDCMVKRAPADVHNACGAAALLLLSKLPAPGLAKFVITTCVSSCSHNISTSQGHFAEETNRTLSCHSHVVTLTRRLRGEPSNLKGLFSAIISI